MEPIARIGISKADLMGKICSVQYFYQTRDREDGPLRRIQKWLYAEEGGVRYSQSNMKLGLRPDDDYVALYYFEGKRYKIMKDGTARVSGADADDMFEDVERDLQNLVDTILSDELMLIVYQAVAESGGKMGGVKAIGDDPGNRSVSAAGIMMPGGLENGGDK